MTEGKNWSVVIYPTSSILPRKEECVDGPMQQYNTSEPHEKHHPMVERPDVFPSEETTIRTPDHGPESSASNTTCQDWQTYPSDDSSFVRWRQLLWDSFDSGKNVRWNVQDSLRVCDSCQMNICSSCGNPFEEDEEYSSCCSNTFRDDYTNHTLSQGRQWPWFPSSPVNHRRWRDTCQESTHPLFDITGRCVPQSKKTLKKPRSTVDSSLSVGELSRYFDLPRKEAARRLGVCVTLLKRRCRELGIHCWPFRKMRCLDDRIRHLQSQKEQHNPLDDDVIDKQIRTLQQRRISLLKNPNIPLKQLLQDQVS